MVLQDKEHPLIRQALRGSKFDEERFFAAAERAATHLRDFARQLRRLRESYAVVAFDFSSAKDGSLTFKKNGSNIMEFYLRSGRSDAFIRFRPTNHAGEDNFIKALGQKLGGRYRDRLQSLFPRGMEMGYPSVNFKVDGAANIMGLLAFREASYVMAVSP
jgi:hypothetical protein